MSISIRITGRDKPVIVEEGATLLDVLHAAGYSVSADCGGTGKCGRCRVKAIEGASRLPLSPAEETRIGKEEASSGVRFACRHEAVDGLVLEVIEELYRQETYKRLGIGMGHPLPLNPAFRMVPLPSRPTVEEALADAGLTVDVDWSALLPDASDPRFSEEQSSRAPDSGERKYDQTAVATDSGRVIALIREPMPLYGIGVDLGTTTIAAYLCDFQTGEIPGVETARNPQVSFGADVMSRIVASRNSQDAKKLKSLACETIASCIKTLCKRYDVQREKLMDALVVGNPTMIHLLVGAPARGIGVAPYRPLFHGGLELRARDLGFPLHPGALVRTLPLPSAFVGADTLAAWLWAERTIDREASTLMLDLGTNGEMVLSANGRLWATSCATGPAFEGATLTCGMQGTPGAIEKIDFEDGKPVLKVIGASPNSDTIPRGICGSGAMSALATFLKEGLIRPDGRYDPDSGSEFLRNNGTGVEFVLYSPEDGNPNGLKPVVLHQKDIRELQFAKGAVASGIRFLCDAAGIEKPDKILLAGAFGNVIQPEDALTIGLIPPTDPENITGIGNAAGLGACMALLDSAANDRAKSLLEQIEVIELGGARGFREIFFASLKFPDPRSGNPGAKS
ncbi:MAG: ASKHA domain-containing protein [Syntrophobacter sp.]